MLEGTVEEVLRASSLGVLERAAFEPLEEAARGNSPLVGVCVLDKDPRELLSSPRKSDFCAGEI